ncbi:MAG: carbohydrate kinase family protein [Desulfobacterales bacterium CG07_land_8_20_14_0_80_52_14]|nr:MAG: carbohydrate kinase family protein [Desulfobacterales bacterium CG23_combo_of_CG06-09_8_20_14_all_52_9]PIU49500.1 MAG: carbohydrate kinase family protein [Desulfobacterales bacterium CG07_land_8_20_14_0_80_52_14]
MNIYVSGSLAYDRIMDFPGRFSDHILPDKIHVLNVCFNVNGLAEKFGGTAGNIAYNLAMLKEKPLILASAGKDFSHYEAWLKENGLSLEGIRVIPEEFTAGAYITTDRGDNQITGFNPGAMRYPSGFSIPDSGQGAIGILSPGNIEDMLTYSREFKAKQIAFIFDPGQTTSAMSGKQVLEILTGCDIFISNDYELEMVLRMTGMTKSDLLAQTKRAIITTLAENGSLLATHEKEVRIPAVPPRQVVDPTGAGDAYRAGLIKGLVSGRPLDTSARMGATCASFAVECKGTQEHRYTPETFWARHHAFFDGKDS